ncbi:MAG: N-acetylglucosamine-6-phosphate deacetylase [Candidatus Rifleibacteriota bacterium]
MCKTIIESRKVPEFVLKKNFVHPQDQLSSSSAIDGFLLPGIIDVHFHGAFGWDFAFGDADKIEEMLDKVLLQGITGVFPTLITCSENQRINALIDIASVIRNRKKPPILHGIYLEGPFLSAARRGSHPEKDLLRPDFALLEKWQDAAEGHIKIITIAPELDGAIEFIEKATESGVVCALGHSDANWQQTQAAIDAGARHVTHLFNAMPALHHRKPNLLSCILANKNLNIELIGDSIHIAPEMIKLAYSIYESDQIIITSDCVATTGLADGTYDLYGRRLIAAQNSCRLEDGNLFGGSATLISSLKKLGQEEKIAWGLLGTSVWRNPCRLMDIEPPDTEVFFDPDFNWLATRHGHSWYTAELDAN